MATEQLPAAQYEIAGQPTVSGYEVIDAQYGFEEDTEDKMDAAGQFKSKITYSRRKTLQLELEAENGSTPETTYQDGGSVTIDTVDYIIRSATIGRTRGVATVSLDLIAQSDEL